MDCFSMLNKRPVGERYMQKKDERKKLNEKLEIMDSFSLLNKMTVGERCMQKNERKIVRKKVKKKLEATRSQLGKGGCQKIKEKIMKKKLKAVDSFSKMNKEKN